MTIIKKLIILIIIILLLGIAAWGGQYLWAWYQTKDIMKMHDAEIALQMADKYGGDTPEETWNMFLTALRAENFDLASKYFVLKRQEEWKGNLIRTKEAGDLPLLMQDITAVPWKVVSLGDNVAEYSIRNSTNILMARPIFETNINNKWKIRSF